MNLHEFERISAEHSALQILLKEIPEANAIDRLSVERRASELERLLYETPVTASRPSGAKVLFRGKPVVGQYGILAQFGTQAIRNFVDAVAAIAANLVGPIGARGTLPNRDSYQMLITGTPTGSFGFELEEYGTGQRQLDFAEQSTVGQAIEQAIGLMKATSGSDDDLADAAAGMSQRAIAALLEFVKTLADNDATCSIESERLQFSFSDTAQVSRTVERLSLDNIREAHEEIEGAFQGVLPKRRTFEFKVSQTGEVINGKVGPTITDANQINEILGQQIAIEVTTTRVGDRPPRYQLTGYHPSASEDANRTD